MIELKGKYNTTKVFTNILEEKAQKQIVELLNQEHFKDSKIRIMPDVHAGIGCTIGTTMTIKDKVTPNLVGVDIGCGMETLCLPIKNIDLVNLNKFIRKNIPSGFNIRNRKHTYHKRIDLNKLKCPIDKNRANLSFGTLGGGNHFIEIDKDQDENLYLIIHSGSRYLGKEIAKHYQNIADNNKDKFNDEISTLIYNLKKENRQNEIQEQIEKFKKENNKNKIPKYLAYLEKDYLKNYLNDMEIAQEYAQINRLAIAKEILYYLNLNMNQCNQFTTIHNYINLEDMILRKGAVSAKKGEIILIPMNMKDGSLICKGKGNSDWNYSAPHGAGRIFSRSQAKDIFKLKDFKVEMKDIYSTSVNISNLDESPMAYKPIDEILNNIDDTVEIVKHIKPIYNFKG